jgi:hypothetical protein
MEAKTVEYCFDSKIYSGEDIKRKIEQIKRDFSRISNKPVEVRVELNELGMYVLTFRFYAKRSIAKMKPEKITKLYIESLGEYSDGYINKLIGNKDSEYIRKLKNRDKEHKQLHKRLKEQNKKKTYARVEYVKEDKKKEQKRVEPEKQKQYHKYNNYNKKTKNIIKQEPVKRTPHIEYLHREEEEKKFTERLNEYLQMLKNVKAPKLERKNKIKVKNKVEKKKIQYEQNITKRANYDSYKNNKKKEQQVGEKHYWSDNYIPKEYGKYKETKKFKPL